MCRACAANSLLRTSGAGLSDVVFLWGRDEWEGGVCELINDGGGGEVFLGLFDLGSRISDLWGRREIGALFSSSRRGCTVHPLYLRWIFFDNISDLNNDEFRRWVLGT